MNEHKFAFIICSNNELFLEECIHYINHLILPEGYELDLLTITDAASMTQGYNEAMTATDAKYKIYMHQDVMILNCNLLKDLLNIFTSDPTIGMIGMVGYETISPDGIMWHTPRKGGLYRRKRAGSYPSLANYRYDINQDHYYPVAEIDGFFMATCQDLLWNTQDLTGWDFYDAFQSLAFLKNGYKIVVPEQKHPWCLHDAGDFSNLTNYDTYRRIFLQKYKDTLGKRYDEILVSPHTPPV